MCLYAVEDRKIATEDIVCYKVLLKRRDYYLTPHQHTYVDINKPLNTKEEKEYVEVEKQGFTKVFTVSRGFIHTYSDKREADLNATSIGGESYVVFKCVIPKGTRYYEGSHWARAYHIDWGYASKEIRFVEKVIEYDNERNYKIF